MLTKFVFIFLLLTNENDHIRKADADNSRFFFGKSQQLVENIFIQFTLIIMHIDVYLIIRMSTKFMSSSASSLFSVDR